MFSATVASKKRVKEAKTHLATSFTHISEEKDKLERLYVQERILRTVENLNDLIYLTAQKIESGIFHEALGLYSKAITLMETLDHGVRETGVVKRITEQLEIKKSEIQQLCIYFLFDQLFNSEVVERGDALLQQLDLGNVLFKLNDDDPKAEGGNSNTKERVVHEEPEQDSGTRQLQTFSRKRVNFIFSIVRRMEGFTGHDYMGYIDTEKLDAMISSFKS
jgi:hypothetical protein